jgi:hypothetical protein
VKRAGGGFAFLLREKRAHGKLIRAQVPGRRRGNVEFGRFNGILCGIVGWLRPSPALNKKTQAFGTASKATEGCGLL